MIYASHLPRLRRLHLWGGLAAVMLLAVAGCGPNGGTPAPTSSGPTGSPPVIAPVPLTQAVAPVSMVDPLSDATAKTLQTKLNQLLAYYGMPGAEAEVIFPDGRTWYGTSGYAVVATKQAWTPETLLSVGSISKTFTGALAVRLFQRGILGVDDSLAKYLPDYPNAANITLRMLMNHTSGIRDLFEPDTYKFIEAKPNATWTADELLSKIGRPYFAPGKGWKYSSTNYVILGQVIEKVTGQKIAPQVRKEFLDPLGMAHTFLQWEEPTPGVFAHGYKGTVSSHYDCSINQPMLPYVAAATALGAAGGVVSTPGDIALWAHALYSGELFDRATLTSIIDASWTNPLNPHFPYGLTLEQFNINNRIAWGHRGHLDGFWSSVVYLPDSGLTVALLTNADWINPLTSIAVLVESITPAAMR